MLQGLQAVRPLSPKITATQTSSSHLSSHLFLEALAGVTHRLGVRACATRVASGAPAQAKYNRSTIILVAFVVFHRSHFGTGLRSCPKAPVRKGCTCSRFLRVARGAPWQSGLPCRVPQSATVYRVDCRSLRQHNEFTPAVCGRIRSSFPQSAAVYRVVHICSIPQISRGMKSCRI